MVKRFSFFKVGQVVCRNLYVWRMNESKIRTRMTVRTRQGDG
jgi:hypothetical protein